MHLVDNDYRERLLDSSGADVGFTRGGGFRRNRPHSNLFRNVIIVFLLCLICVVVFWIYTGVFRAAADKPQHGRPSVMWTKLNYTAVLIYLHGLGGTGGYVCDHRIWTMNLPSHIRSICPTADIMTVTFSNNTEQTSWFNIFQLTGDDKEDEPGIKLAAKRIESLIDDEVKLGVPRSRIILGGASQGGATSLYTAFTSTKDSLAGVFGTSTWLPLLKTFPEAFRGNKDTPLFQTHGDADELVPLSYGKKSSDMIKSYDSNALFKVYEGLGHSYSPKMYQSVKVFIVKNLPPI